MHKRLLYTGEKQTKLIYTSLTTISDEFKAISHSHQNAELICVSEGEGHIITRNEKIKLFKGDLALISGGVEHREERFIGKVFSFYAVGLKDYGLLNKEELKIFSPNKKDMESFLNCFTGIFNELKTNDKFVDDAVYLYTELLCTLTSRYLSAKSGVVESSKKSLVESAKRFIDGRFYSPIKLNEMANSLSVSYSTLIHTFKKETGITITEYKLLKQIEESKSLLSLTDMSINQIALSVGFGTNTYFTKIFKRETGLTPKKYREMTDKKINTLS